MHIEEVGKCLDKWGDDLSSDTHERRGPQTLVPLYRITMNCNVIMYYKSNADVCITKKQRSGERAKIRKSVRRHGSFCCEEHRIKNG